MVGPSLAVNSNREQSFVPHPSGWFPILLDEPIRNGDILVNPPEDETIAAAWNNRARMILVIHHETLIHDTLAGLRSSAPQRAHMTGYRYIGDDGDRWLDSIVTAKQRITFRSTNALPVPLP